MKRKLAMILGVMLFFQVSVSFALESSNFSANETVVDSGGGNQSSTAYITIDSVGQKITDEANSSVYINAFGIHSYVGLRLTPTEGIGKTVGSQEDQEINLTFNAWNVENNTPVVGASGTIWVENQSGTFDAGHACTTDANGNCTITFNPDCSYTGGQRIFKGGVTGVEEFFDTNSSDGVLTIDSAPSCNNAVSFTLELAIDGAANDEAFVDTQGTGYYKPAEIANPFICLRDTSISGTPIFGLVFAGQTLESLNLTAGNSYRMTITQSEAGNKFIIPVTKDSCEVIRNAFDVLNTFSILTRAFVSFTSSGTYPVQLIVGYPVDLIGDFSKSGVFSLVITKNQSNGNQLIIEGI